MGVFNEDHCEGGEIVAMVGAFQAELSSNPDDTPVISVRFNGEEFPNIEDLRSLLTLGEHGGLFSLVETVVPFLVFYDYRKLQEATELKSFLTCTADVHKQLSPSLGHLLLRAFLIISNKYIPDEEETTSLKLAGIQLKTDTRELHRGGSTPPTASEPSQRSA